MLTYKHLLVLMSAVLLSVQIIHAEDLEVEIPATNWEKTEEETSSGTSTDDSMLGQSLWSTFGHKFGSELYHPGSLVDPIGMFFPTLSTFTTPYQFTPNFLSSPLLPSPARNIDLLPASSNVVLLLADDKRSRNVKRSPIFPKELLRQTRQSNDFQTMLQQVLGQVNQGMTTMLGQSQEDQTRPNFNALLSQAMSPFLPNNNTDSTDDSQSILGQALNNNPFNLDTFMSGLGQMMGAESQISEVRVKPETGTQTTEEQLATKKLQEMRFNMMLLKALSDKKLPILWFRDIQHKTTLNDKKTPEEILMEQKLYAFERQVIRELRLLQEIERQAREMQVTKGSDYKMNYPLNEKPVHRITLEDIEKALANEYVLKMLQQKMQMQATDKPAKRHSHQTFNKEEAAQILAYAIRNGAALKEAAKTNEESSKPIQQNFENKANMGNMEMRNNEDIQSIDQMQKNWMQTQYQDTKARWAAEQANYQQEQQQQQNPLEFVGGQQSEHAELENENMNEGERKKGFKGFGGFDRFDRFDDFDSPVYHYHYYMPAKSEYNSGSYGSRPSYSSSYSAGPSYSSSYSSGQSYGSSSGGYRTATGDEEIEKLLGTDPAFMELNQQKQQQEEELKTAKIDTTRLASNVRYWLLSGLENKQTIEGFRQKRHVGTPSLQAIDEDALNELRATYGSALKEITLLPNEDPSEALMRYNAAGYQEVLVDEQGEPVEIDSQSLQSGLNNQVIDYSTTHSDRHIPTKLKQPVFLPQMNNAGSLTAIEASALFDSTNITQSLISSVLEEVNRRLTNCCTKCKDSIIEDIKEKLNRNEKIEENDNKDNQYFEDWLRYMSSKGYDQKRLNNKHYSDFLRYNKLSHFDKNQTNNFKRETNDANLNNSQQNMNESIDKTGKYLRRHIPKRLKAETDVVDEKNKEVAQNVSYNLKQDDEIVSQEIMSSTQTSTMKSRKRLRRRKNKKNQTTTTIETTTTMSIPTTTMSIPITTLTESA